MPDALLYQSGEAILRGDHVLLHGLPAVVEFVLSGVNDTAEWGACGPGVMIAEPAQFGHLFLQAQDLQDYEDLELVSRARRGMRDSPLVGRQQSAGGRPARQLAERARANAILYPGQGSALLRTPRAAPILHGLRRTLKSADQRAYKRHLVAKYLPLR
jgi:hypothetical protein